MTDQYSDAETADLQAWNKRYDDAVAAGCDPAEAVARADQASRPVPPAALPQRTAPKKPAQPAEDPEVVRRRQEFEKWNAANELQKQRRAAGREHIEAERAKRRQEFYDWMHSGGDQSRQPSAPPKHRSLDEP